MPNLSIFRSENSDLLYSFFLYFLQELSNPVLFGHCRCYFKKVEISESRFCVKLQFKYFNSLEQQQQCAKSTGFDNSCKKQKKNEYNRSEFSDQKIDRFGLQARLKLALQIHYTHCLFFVKCKCPNGYSVRQLALLILLGVYDCNLKLYLRFQF